MFNIHLLLFILLNLFFINCSRSQEGDYPIKFVSIADVELTDDFWTHMINKNREVTIPYVIDQLTAKGTEISSNSKVLEGISFYLMQEKDTELETLADSLISYFQTMQQENGYIGPNKYKADGANISDSTFWLGRTGDFGETGGISGLYGVGHFYEAAVAYYEATGKKKLLDIAEENAEFLLTVFGPDKLAGYPYHPEIELALVKLYRVTGKRKFLDLSKFFLDSRGPNGTKYSQSHKKIVDQTEAIGHAVRALYLYSGISDIAALTDDNNYKEAIDAIWNSVVDSKLYITGGVGAYADHEAIGESYDLPNLTAYNETCASIANIFWNNRMFLLNGDASYIDVLERTLYNSVLSGVSISGDRFFYPNPLASNGQYQRASWYGVPCCPPNIIRFMPQIPGYIYASMENNLYVNLFMENSSQIDLPSGKIGITQETEYPRQGKIKIVVNPTENTEFTLRIRIPGWTKQNPLSSGLYSFLNKSTEEVKITLNNEPLNYNTEKGYAIINRNWSAGDIVTLDIPMETRKVMANDKVKDDHGRFAIQRGPVVYCIEGQDNKDGRVNNIMIPKEAEFELEFREDLFDGTLALVTSGYSYKEQQNKEKIKSSKQKITAIPYYLWANRGPSEMAVWIPFQESVVTPTPKKLPTITSKSSVLSSYHTTTLSGINDQLIIPYNQNIPISNYYRWPMNDTIQWVQYLFEEPKKLSSAEVYWYDNEPSRMTTWYDDNPWTCCRVPESWELFYLDTKNEWQPVKALNEYGTKRDVYNEVNFEQVTTRSMRMVVRRHETCASGLQEWVLN
tara:strand:+ start:4882 stop:7266 length:2385 start_codon:yes stop_codon:yes gene_type:complete